MHVFRPETWRRDPKGKILTDAATGEPLRDKRGRVLRDWIRDVSGEPRRFVSKTWFVSVTIAGRRVRRSLHVRDKAAALELARQIVTRAERERAGMVDPAAEQFVRPIADHVAEFDTVLRGQGVTEKHRRDRLSMLDAFIAATGARTLRDFSEARAAAWIDAVSREQTRLGAARSARDVNRRIRALRQFAAWLVANHRVPFDPLPTLKPRNEKADRRHERRALTPDEARRLLAAAAARPLAFDEGRRVRTATPPAKRAALAALGRERAILYGAALYTACRRNELASLTWADVDLERRTLRVVARTAKARRERVAELRDDVVTALRGLRAARGEVPPSAHVFRPEAFPTGRGFALDLLAAGIARLEDEAQEGPAKSTRATETSREAGPRPSRRRKVVVLDERGRTLDFHALRVTAVTWAQVHAGASVREVQAIAGHQHPDLTLTAYTDPALLGVRRVYDALPGLGVEHLADLGTLAGTLAHGSPQGAASGRSAPLARGACRNRGAPAAARIPANSGELVAAEGSADTWIRTRDLRLMKPNAAPHVADAPVVCNPAGVADLRPSAPLVRAPSGARTLAGTLAEAPRFDPSRPDTAPDASRAKAPRLGMAVRFDPVGLADALLVRAQAGPECVPLVAAARSLLPPAPGPGPRPVGGEGRDALELVAELLDQVGAGAAAPPLIAAARAILGQLLRFDLEARSTESAG